MATSARVRWVGFDMDECLGSFMSLWPFVELLPEEARMSNNQLTEYLQSIAKRVAQQPLQLFRPGIPELLRRLRDAQQKGAIAGCFILTNNGSKELAEVVRMALNAMADKDLFRIAWHRYSPCRQGNENPRKDWATIQACLRASGLPTMSLVSDLLYYDDQEHVLKSEIPYYVTVPEYTIETPVNLVYNTIKPVIQRFDVPATIQQRVLQDALKDQRNLKTGAQSAFPTSELDQFVGSVGGYRKARIPRTRKARKVGEKTLRGRRGKKKGQKLTRLRI